MTNMFRILLLLVVPGHLIFSFTISLLEAGHTIPTFLFVITYLAAALLQVCKVAAGKKIIIKWSNFIQFNNVKQNRTSCCISNFIQVYPTLSPTLSNSTMSKRTEPTGASQVCLLLHVCRLLVPFLWSRGTDPDSAAIPYLTALGDLLGGGLLALAFVLLTLAGQEEEWSSDNANNITSTTMAPVSLAKSLSSTLAPSLSTLAKDLNQAGIPGVR